MWHTKIFRSAAIYGTNNTVFDLISEYALISGHPPFFVLKKIYIFIYFYLFYFNINNYFK